MKIIMIKKKGCNPCKMFEPTIKNVAKQNSLDYKAVQVEDMPENMRPDVFPYFYLLKGEDLLESWAGTNLRKMSKVLSRHVSNFSFTEQLYKKYQDFILINNPLLFSSLLFHHHIYKNVAEKKIIMDYKLR